MVVMVVVTMVTGRENTEQCDISKRLRAGDIYIYIYILLHKCIYICMYYIYIHVHIYIYMQ